MRQNARNQKGMIEDLTPSFERAIHQIKTWNANRLQSLIKSIEDRYPSTTIDWDGSFDSGETWIRVLREEQVEALIRVDAPLAFVAGPNADRLNDFFIEADIVSVSVDDLHEQKFRLDIKTLEDSLTRWYWRSPTIDPGSFSIMDLWWVTV